VKLFAIYAVTSDGFRDLLMIRKLPAEFDWAAFDSQRADAKRTLGIVRYEVEELYSWT